MEFTVSSGAPDRVTADLLAVPVFTESTFGPGAGAVDRAIGGGLADFMTEADFTGKLGQVLAVPTRGALGSAAALLVGMGDPKELDAEAIRRAGATIARQARKTPVVATTVLDAAPKSLDRAAAAQALAEGLALGGYQFLKYKAEGESGQLEKVIVLTAKASGVRPALERGDLVAQATCWARDIENEPSAAKSPTAFAQAAQKLLRGTGVKVEVLDVKEMKADKMGGVLGVGQGSSNPPRFVKLTYTPKGAKPGVLAFVGKGVVFDSGGLSLKTSTGMETMKMDMSGGAAVIAAMSVLREVAVKHKVVGYVPMVENMPSGSAIRPGDVLDMRDGTTVEVLNTDAEGRLIRADALSKAADEGADAIVDLATLTGACMVALGEKIAGLMGNDDGFTQQVQAAADHAGERVWHLPLPDDYAKLLESEIADLRNISTGGYGGTLTAGLFLQHFVGDVPWAHVDIAGPARASSDDGEWVKGGTGFGVRTLVELATRFRNPRR